MFNTLFTIKCAMYIKVEEKLITAAKVCLLQSTQLKWFSTKPNVKLDDNIDDMLKNQTLYHKHHPGIIQPKCITHPPWLVPVTRQIMTDYAVCKVDTYKYADMLYRHLKQRHMPLEGNALNIGLQKIRKRLDERKLDFQFETLDELRNNKKAKHIAQQFLYNWSAMDYNKYNSLLYLIARSMPDYAVLSKIFGEIHDRDKDFMPQTLFDFGSGIGSVLWATSKYWSESLKEHYCMDISADINSLREKILKMSDLSIKGLFHRQFFPLNTSTFDIVVCAYSLFELPNLRTRLDTIMKLWKKTQNYLVIVEQGSNAGFKLICEARDFILSLSRDKSTHSRFMGHVFAPCPHNMECPILEGTSRPCNFEVIYLSMPFPRTSEYRHENYCYMVLKKGERCKESSWPRLTAPIIKRTNHVICQMCTSSGALQNIVITKGKHGRDVYRCARNCKWGDRFPGYLDTQE